MEEQKTEERKRDKRVREKQMMLRLDDNEYDILTREAAMAGMKLATYCRELIFRGTVHLDFPVTGDPPALQETARQMMRIAEELRDLRREFRTGGTRAEDMRMRLNRIMAELLEIKRLLEKRAGDGYGAA